MNYSECLDFLYTTLPMFSKTGHAAMKEGLGNTLAICDFLGHPERKLKYIHVAGTNGKGSVSHMLAAVLQSAGYTTGLYTSPHLSDFRERIRVNGNMISQEDVIRFTEEMKPVIAGVQPSFFELTVGMALDHFVREGVDVAVIETGLGGRLDSTNVIDPELSVITNIGFDHMQILGDTIEKIAFEKAGIIKRNKPVIIGRACEKSRAVFTQKAELEKAPLLFAKELTSASVLSMTPEKIELEILDVTTTEKTLICSDLPGLYQQENICTVYTVLQQLIKGGWKINAQQIQQGISQTQKLTGLRGRWEMLRKQPLLMADVAHNEDGIKNLIAQIHATAHEKLFLVLGLSKEKDAEAILSLLPVNATYCFTQADIPRALDKDTLCEKARSFNLLGAVHPTVNDAIGHCLEKATPRDLVVVCGSVFVVGEIDRKRFSQ